MGSIIFDKAAFMNYLMAKCNFSAKRHGMGLYLG